MEEAMEQNSVCPHLNTCSVHRCDICAFAKGFTYRAIKAANEPYLAYSCETFGQFDVSNLFCGDCPLRVNCMKEQEKRQEYLDSLTEIEVLIKIIQEKITKTKGE